MDNPFSYPSLAFGAEAMQLGDSLKRYQSFRTESEPLETDGEREQPMYRPQIFLMTHPLQEG